VAATEVGGGRSAHPRPVGRGPQAGSLAVAARLLPEDLGAGPNCSRPGANTRPDLRCYVVGATRFEPVTSSVSANGREALCG
jgi:hypothetical protein